MYGAKVNRCDEADCIHNSFNRCEVCKNPIFAVKIEGGKCKSFKDEKSQLRDEAKKAIINYLGEAADVTIDAILMISKVLIENPRKTFTVTMNGWRESENSWSMNGWRESENSWSSIDINLSG